MRPDYGSELEGKIAVVTGAAQGIGLAIARAFCAAGARVALLDRNRENAETAAHKIAAAGTLAIETDVGDQASVDSAMETVIREWGRVDVLVNNAGIQWNCASLDLKAEDLQRVLNVNLLGAFHGCQAAARLAMSQQRSGAIVNISSVASQLAFPRRLAYGIAKAGINALTRILASEWAEHNIRVNAIAPGYIRTELVEYAARSGHIDLDAVTAKTPLGRLGTVEEIAELAMYLASCRSGFITGQVVTIDGGFVLSK